MHLVYSYHTMPNPRNGKQNNNLDMMPNPRTKKPKEANKPTNINDLDTMFILQRFRLVWKTCFFVLCLLFVCFV